MGAVPRPQNPRPVYPPAPPPGSAISSCYATPSTSGGQGPRAGLAGPEAFVPFVYTGNRIFNSVNVLKDKYTYAPSLSPNSSPPDSVL